MSKESIFYTVDIKSKKDVKEIKKGLDTVKGVMSVSINPDTSKVCVDCDSDCINEVEKAFKTLGYDVKGESKDKDFI